MAHIMYLISNIQSQNKQRASQILQWLQMAVASSIGWPATRLVGRHSDAAPKHSLCYFSSVSEMVMLIDVHLQSGVVSVY